MMVVSKRLDKTDVEQAAHGRWDFILSTVAGVDSAILDGVHHPCPNCGGTDRFNADREKFATTGQVWCNQDCRLSGNGFHVIQMLLHVDFQQALAMVATCVNINVPLPPAHNAAKEEPSKSTYDVTKPNKAVGSKRTKTGRSRKPNSDLEFRELIKRETSGKRNCARNQKLREWASNKPGVHVDTLLSSATRLTRRSYLGQECVVFIGTTINQKITGLQYAPVDGSQFLAFQSRGPKKTLNRKGSKDGWIIPLGTAAAKAAETIVLCEGPGDAFSVQRLLPEGTVAVTNLCGAGSLPNDLAWLKGKEVVVIYDPDAAGQEGAAKACEKLATFASVQNVNLQNGDRDDDDQEG
jgi:phage/plasmid primase-like uncharacterized protein